MQPLMQREPDRCQRHQQPTSISMIEAEHGLTIRTPKSSRSFLTRWHMAGVQKKSTSSMPTSPWHRFTPPCRITMTTKRSLMPKSSVNGRNTRYSGQASRIRQYRSGYWRWVNSRERCAVYGCPCTKCNHLWISLTRDGGPPNRSSRLFLGIPCRAISYGIGTRFTVWRSNNASRTWASKKVKIALRSPWQNPYGERLIGSIRRNVLDHVIVLNGRHLGRMLTAYISYYHRFRTYLSLEMDCPTPRAIQPPALGPVRSLPEVGGLHHHYERIAA